MPDLMCPDHATLTYLEAIESRLTAILPLAAGTNAWRHLKRLREDVRQEIAAGWADLNQMADEMMAADASVADCYADGV